MIVEEGQLKGEFRGFKNPDTIFEFNGGGKWQQVQYKSHNHYAYMPHAKVIENGGRYVLHVEGIKDAIEVRKA